MDMRRPFPWTDIAVIHMENVDLLQLFFPNEVNLETSVKIFERWVFVIIPVFQFEELVNRDNPSLHSLHCMNVRFLRIWK